MVGTSQVVQLNWHLKERPDQVDGRERPLPGAASLVMDLDAPVVQALTQHFAAMRKLQQQMRQYQWRAIEHGWGALLAQQHREMEAWRVSICESFEQRGIVIPLPVPAQADTHPVDEEEVFLGPADGYALAAAMMAAMETLAWNIEGIFDMAEKCQSMMVTDTLFGLNLFYHRSAAMYRGYLCSEVSWLNQ